MDEEKLKEYKGKAQAKIDGIAQDILDGPYSLTHWLVKAYRAGHPAERAVAALTEIKRCADDALATYHAAIAQPEPKISTKRRVEL